MAKTARPWSNRAIRYPIAEESRLHVDAPVGIYVVGHERQAGTWIATSRFLNGERFRLIARVRESGEIPSGVDSCFQRDDGKQVVMQWVPELSVTR